MTKFLLGLVLLSTSLFAVDSALEKAYKRGQEIASKIPIDIAQTVRIQKCKYYVVVDSSISAKMRVEAFKGCEDKIFGAEK